MSDSEANLLRFANDVKKGGLLLVASIVSGLSQ